MTQPGEQVVPLAYRPSASSAGEEFMPDVSFSGLTPPARSWPKYDSGNAGRTPTEVTYFQNLKNNGGKAIEYYRNIVHTVRRGESPESIATRIVGGTTVPKGTDQREISKGILSWMQSQTPPISTLQPKIHKIPMGPIIEEAIRRSTLQYAFKANALLTIPNDHVIPSAIPSRADGNRYGIPGQTLNKGELYQLARETISRINSIGADGKYVPIDPAITPEILFGLMSQESQGRIFARSNVVPPAQGIAQIRPQTGRELYEAIYGKGTFDSKLLFNPTVCAELAARHLSKLYRQSPDAAPMKLALYKYNVGEGEAARLGNDHTRNGYAQGVLAYASTAPSLTDPLLASRNDR